MTNKNLKNMSYAIEGTRLVITMDISDIIANPEAVLSYEPSSTGNSYTIGTIGNNFGGERVQGHPISIKCSVYSGKKDLEDIKNLIATRKMKEEAEARQRELEELRELRELLKNPEVKKALESVRK